MAALLTSLPSPSTAVPALSDAWRTLLAKVLTNVTVRTDDGAVQIGDGSIGSYVLAYTPSGLLYCGEDNVIPEIKHWAMLVLPTATISANVQEASII